MTYLYGEDDGLVGVRTAGELSADDAAGHAQQTPLAVLQKHAT